MFDSHCHLDFDELVSERVGVLAAARQAGVLEWFVPGCGPSTWASVQVLASEPGVVVGHGVHPWWAHEVSDPQATWDQLAVALAGPRVVALGECGLDGVRADRVPLERQQQLFEAQLALAGELGLPVVLHQVRARDAFLSSLGRVGVPAAGGVVHGFSGDAAWARALTDRGLHLGIGPALLRRGREGLQRVVAETPLEHLLVETDAPDQGIDGARGRPADLARVVAEVARLRDQDPLAVGQATAENARRLFRVGAS